MYLFFFLPFFEGVEMSRMNKRKMYFFPEMYYKTSLSNCQLKYINNN